MRIVVLAKGVPAVGDEKLGADLHTDRDRLEPNGADEYGAEAALRLVDEGRAEVTVVCMGPESALEAVRKLLAMGAADGVLISDPALSGACTLTTGRVLAAALAKLDYDLIVVGADTSDGGAGVVPAALAARLGLPFVSAVTAFGLESDGVMRFDRLGEEGEETVEVQLPAVIVGSQLLGEPRYPAFRGIIAAKSKPLVTWTLADLGLDPADLTPSTRAVAAEAVEAIRAQERVTGSPDDAVARIIEFLDAKEIRA